MTSLWGIYDGEPFMENPSLAIIGNPRLQTKGKKRKMARRRKSSSSLKARMAHVRSFRKTARRKTTKRRAKRNPYPIGGVALNPKRRRRSTYVAKRRSMRRRRGKRNPSIAGFALPPFQSVLYTGVGFLGVPLVEGFLNRFVPVSITGNQFGKYAVRIASVVGLSFLAKQVVGAEEAKKVAIGGGAYVLTTAAAEFLPESIKQSIGLSAYVQPGLSAYVDGGRSTGLGLPSAGGSTFGQGNTSIGGTAERFKKF